MSEPSTCRPGTEIIATQPRGKHYQRANFRECITLVEYAFALQQFLKQTRPLVTSR